MSILKGRFLGKYNILIITLANADMETELKDSALSRKFQSLQVSLSGLEEGWVIFQLPSWVYLRGKGIY